MNTDSTKEDCQTKEVKRTRHGVKTLLSECNEKRKERNRNEKFSPRYPLPVQIMGWFMRILLGALFIYSGFTKGVDPWGTFYKFNDYLAALDLQFSNGVVLSGVFLLFSFEFVTGVFLTTGCFRRITMVCVAAIMLFMLPLSAWLAIAEPVSDCGCFGDAWILTNWQTFWKNVLLSAMVVWLIPVNHRLHWLVTPALQWLVFTLSAAYIILIGIIGYNIQPVIDYRPYKVGTNLRGDNQEDSDGNPENVVFIYEKEGKQKEFSIDQEMPDEDEGWTFIGTKGDEQKATESTDGLTVWSAGGEEDLTDEALSDIGREMIILMPTVSDSSIISAWSINSLYNWCNSNGVNMVAILGSDKRGVDFWRDISMAEYPIYTAEDTTIKEIARGNPGVVYIDNGIIRNKSTLAAIDNDLFQEKAGVEDPSRLFMDTSGIFRTITLTYILLLLTLCVSSFLPQWIRFLVNMVINR